MKKIITARLLLIVCAIHFVLIWSVVAHAEPGRITTVFPGTIVMVDKNGNDIPDTTIIEASGSRTYIVTTRTIKDLFFDISCDQDATVVITPLPVYGDTDTVGAASDTLSVTASTPARGSYADIAAPAAKIVVTNSAASDMTSYLFTVRGSVR